MPTVKEKKPAFTLTDVTFAYAGTPVVEDLTLTVAQGEYLGIVGPNGGGKTTLLKLMLGLLKPSVGTVTLFGDPIGRSRHRHALGYVPQRTLGIDGRFPATVEEIVTSGRTARQPWFGQGSIDKHKVLAAMKTAGVAHLKDRRVGTLSGGERQRVLIARALAGEPSILLLDEPTSAIDALSQDDFYDFLRKLHRTLGLTIIIISHDIDVVAHEVDSVLCINRKMISYGPAHEALKMFVHHEHEHRL